MKDALTSENTQAFMVTTHKNTGCDYCRCSKADAGKGRGLDLRRHILLCDELSTD